jgi:hypothetical protein
MAPSLHPPSIWNALCLQCFILYISRDLLRHVKNAHLHANLVSQASQATLSLQMSSLFVLHPCSIPFAFWVRFGLSLISFWGCLKFVSCAFICFIRSLEPFKTKLGRFFAYPLTKLLEIQWTNQHGSFSSCCVYIILKEIILVSEMYLPTLGGLWQATGFLFKRRPFVFHVLSIPTIKWKIFQPLIFAKI